MITLAQLDLFLTIRILSSLAMLLCGSYSDLKSREVNDNVWITFGIIGLGINFIQFIIFGLESISPIISIISFAVSSGLAIFLYILRFYGGADAKAIIVLAIILPTYPMTYELHPIAPLAVLTNGLFIALILPLGYLILNIMKIMKKERIFEGFETESFSRKLVASLLGYRTRNIGESNFLLIMEQKIGDKKRFDFRMLNDSFEFTSKANTWVTPGIPLLLFITVGFLLTMYPGDLLAIIMYQFVGLISS